MKFLTCALLLVLSACSGEGPGIAQVDDDGASGLVDPSRIGSTLSGFIERGELAGVSALVFEDGEEAFFGAYGMADREAERPMRRDTLVRIFSMTKPLTGVVLMSFYEEGRFALDDPLEKYLPEFAGVEVYAGEEDGEAQYRAPARPPTIRDILRHTAGFANGDGGDASAVGERYREVDPGNPRNSLEQLTAKLASVPLLYEPGTRWYYGPSVDVQARLAEVLGGKPYAEILKKRVLDPLEMTDTQYTLRPDQLKRFSVLYERSPDGSFTPARGDIATFNTREWPLTPGGWGLTSTLDDYMRFARMLLNEGELDGVRILEVETVRLMATDALPPELTDRWWLVNKGQVGFGIDFAVRVAPPATNAEASGAVGEFFWDGLANTLFWVDPRNDIAAVLFNQYIPYGKTEIMKDFRDAIYYRDEEATALHKPEAGPDTPRMSD
jgi:CubicO group peptidase (beta-lactamase class C family)